MSLFTALNRFAREIGARRRAARTRNQINSLPAEIRKDIGWPDACDRPRSAERTPRG